MKHDKHTQWMIDNGLIAFIEPERFVISEKGQLYFKIKKQEEMKKLLETEPKEEA